MDRQKLTKVKSSQKEKDLRTYTLPELGTSNWDDLLYEPLENLIPKNLSYPHRHDFYEILIVRSGTGKIRIDSREYSLSENMMFFLTPYQAHRSEWSSKAQGSVLMFKESFLLADSNSKGPWEYPFFHSIESTPALDFSKIPSILNVLLLFEEEWSRKENSNRNILRNYSEILMILAERSYEELPGGISSKTGSLVRKFLKLVGESPNASKSVRNYASKLLVTPGHLNDTVKKETNRTASDFLKERINLEAKRLLEHTDASVAEISIKLGFNDHSYFIRFFKKENGITPSEYRISRIRK
ncbi:hypothetical protein A0128_00400 [Leptospira tipperaryensis]|uniref:HTH araC/xylS-type domain-containing protein n=1 Tax=Leptospira tipperaryensis TaxID=2564040 RepID=A0A1D7USF4_9LEPT|nr:helix-turn-helix domain-containing protein [Leptospira tipperaryensis]AOP32474.1 hypothetical protein A0128_00400 [Leptospira tipperaryensis]